MQRIFLKDREEDRIRLGHPWVFDNEIGVYQGECASGSTVDVMTKSGHFLGRGVINRASKITVRIFTRDKTEAIDRDFFLKRIRGALESRLVFYDADDSYRLLFAESDFIPGLVVDLFKSVEGKVFLVVQFLTLGVDVFRAEILSCLEEVLSPDGIFERSDVHVRALEGLEEKKGWTGKKSNPLIQIQENGIVLTVDLENGQKTGYFLDQKENRRVVSRIAKGKRVLDTFTHTGAFGLNAWKGGALSVLSVDISQEAVERVRDNILHNGAEASMTASCADVFDLLKDLEKQGTEFDCIILDPPAFTKNAKMAEKAYGGYKEINLRAMKILSRGGYLVTCSCSHFFGSDLFYRMLANAAMDAKRSVQILSKTGPGFDHPSLIGYPESDYLKCAVLRVW